MKPSKILILCLCFVILSGCQGKKVTAVESSPGETTLTTTAEPETTTTETTESETSEPQTTAAETADAAQSTLHPDAGSWDGTTYHNEFAQLTFHLPGQWESTPSEDIPEKLGISKAQLDTQPSASYAMLAMNPATSAAVNLNFENLNMVAGATDITVEDYSEILKSVVSQSFDYKFENLYEKELGGSTYTVLECNLPDYGVGLHYYLRKIDNVIVCLSLNFGPNDSMEEILKSFE